MFHHREWHLRSLQGLVDLRATEPPPHENVLPLSPVDLSLSSEPTTVIPLFKNGNVLAFVARHPKVDKISMVRSYPASAMQNGDSFISGQRHGIGSSSSARRRHCSRKCLSSMSLATLFLFPWLTVFFLQGNFLVTDDLRVVITDARQYSHIRQICFDLNGYAEGRPWSWNFRAPEELVAESVMKPNKKLDVYALASTIYSVRHLPFSIELFNNVGLETVIYIQTTALLVPGGCKTRGKEQRPLRRTQATAWHE
jgi:hypothetical protein